MRNQRLRGALALIGLAVVLVLLLWARGGGPDPGGADDSGRTPAASASSTWDRERVPLDALPSQVAETVRLIENGGPFPYSRDGVVFRNAERLLPEHPIGWYHEYTVPTPGSQDRGARRIVQGRDGALYYTGDHYRSFVSVATE